VTAPGVPSIPRVPLLVRSPSSLYMEFNNSVGSTNSMDLDAKSALRGASEEEISEFIQETLRELALMACFISMPSDRRKRIEEAIALLEGCAGLYHRRNSAEYAGVQSRFAHCQGCSVRSVSASSAGSGLYICACNKVPILLGHGGEPA
jgi:hypothetical protein